MAAGNRKKTSGVHFCHKIRNSSVTAVLLTVTQDKFRKLKLFYCQKNERYRAKELPRGIFLGNLSSNEGKISVGLPVLNFRIWWRHVKTKNWTFWDILSFYHSGTFQNISEFWVKVYITISYAGVRLLKINIYLDLWKHSPRNWHLLRLSMLKEYANAENKIWVHHKIKRSKNSMKEKNVAFLWNQTWHWHLHEMKHDLWLHKHVTSEQ